MTARRHCVAGGIEEFDWAQRKKYEEFELRYALIRFKTLSSQWGNVMLFDESFAFPHNRERCFLTEFTRTAKRPTAAVPHSSRAAAVPYIVVTFANTPAPVDFEQHPDAFVKEDL